MASRNLMLDFMQGYQFGDNIERQDRAEARQVDATKRTNELQDRQVAKYDKDLSEQNAQRGLNAARYELRTTGGVSPDTLGALPKELQDAINAAGPAAQAQVADKIANPQRIVEERGLWDGIKGALDQGELPPGEMTLRYLNSISKEELDLRGGKDGLTRHINNFVPSPDGTGLMFDLGVTNADGKRYYAPATVGGLPAGNGKDVVEHFPVEKVIKRGADVDVLNRLLETHLIKNGDTTILANIQKRQEEAEKMAATQKQKAWEYANDPAKRYITLGARGALDSQTGLTIGPAGGLGVPKGIWITNADGEKEWLPTGETAKVQSKQHIKQNGDGTTTVYDEGTGTFRVVHTPETAMKLAEAQAQAEADAQGEGWFKLNPSKAKVMERAKEIQKELLAPPTNPAAARKISAAEAIRVLDQKVQSGEATAAEVDELRKGLAAQDPRTPTDITSWKFKGNSPPTQYSPGQKLMQGGKTYVVDANGVPQESAGQASAPASLGLTQRGTPVKDQSNMSQEQRGAADNAKRKDLGPLPVPSRVLSGLETNNAKVIRDAAETQANVRAGLSQKESVVERQELSRLSEIANSLKAKKARGTLSTGKDQADYEKAVALGLIVEPTRR